MSGAPSTQSNGTRRTALWCAVVVAGMLGLAYASVPLYNLFCRVTGFDGTPMIATQAPTTVGQRVIRVRFDGNVAPGLPWRFTPDEPHIDMKPGETRTIAYNATSFGRGETMGTATFNVYPPVAAQYFNKLQCFCFNDTPLKAGESTEVPVVFFLDPALEKDPDMRDVQTVTLSYTFFPTKNPRPQTTASATPAIR